MKRDFCFKRIPALVVVMCLLLSLASCKILVDTGQPVTVNIVDNGVTSTVEGADNMTVNKLLETAGIVLGSQDAVTPEGDAVWRDTGADAIVISRHATVTVTDGATSQSVELVGGTVGDAITKAGFDPKNYMTEADRNAPLTDGMVITLTAVSDGFVSDGVYSYYYQQGQLVTNAVVGDDMNGWFYANAQGVIDLNYCDAVNVNGTDYIVINGRATPVVSAFDATLYAAARDIGVCTDPSMTKDEKLRAAFDYLKTNYLEGVLHDPPYREPDWHIVCANDIFVYGKGDCFSYGAAFAFMAKAIGCDEVYACNSGGHGWAEVEGKAYDPEWSLHSNNYPYFAMSPEDECDVNYWTTTADADWKRKAL